MEKFGKNPWENVSTDEELANANKILKESNPALYEHILEFAQENHLKICDTVIKTDKDDKNTI